MTAKIDRKGRAPMELSDWEKGTLRRMVYEYKRAVDRKRSWRPSEKAVTKADATMLFESITGESYYKEADYKEAE